MKLQHLILLGVVPILSSCDQNTRTIASVRAAIQKQLIDPQSAQFSDEFIGLGGRAVCGFVNAKNRLGVYTGRKPYQGYYSDSGANASFIPTLPDMDDIRKLASLKGRQAAEKKEGIDLGCIGALAVKTICPEEYLAMLGPGLKVCTIWDEAKRDAK